MTDSHLQLATFLFTDIEGSAKRWEHAPEKMKVALQRHHAILQQAISANGGAVFQIIGDAFCAAFPTVLSAVSAAVLAQQELHQESSDLPFPIRVRMGIHTGEAERTSIDNYASGPTLNRVARILTAAHGGQVLLSLATKDLVKDSLPANTELRDMGEHHLRNLMYPEHLFQLNIAGLPSEFPPLNTLTHRHNLPVQVTSFIAREQEINLIHEYLLKDDIRLVTLIGPPGIGKTRLSIEAARAALQDFSEGVFFVALAPLEDSNLIAAAIAQALGYVGAKNISTTEQLKEGIADKKLLLVLDNCEHLIEAVALLAADLLSACSQLKILATSRESLRIPGEWLYAVPAFDLPTERASLDVESASQYPALTLFAERARAVRSDFSLKAENVETIAEICARLDGLPLVIELIAARIRMMTPQTLLARLTSQFVLTADGMRAASERQKTLYNAIDWSYTLLPPEEQKLFAYLSVFSGGFTLDAVEALFSQKITEKSLPTLIALLLDKSLIKFVPDLEASGDTRYTMLVTIQEYARERLQEMGEEAEIRNWHLDYFLDLAETGEPHLYDHEQLRWLARLQTEMDNFRVAFEWILTGRTDSEKGLRLANALFPFWRIRSEFHEALHWFDAILKLPAVAQSPTVYAKGLLSMGIIQMWSISAEAGEPYLLKSVQFARTLNDRLLLAEALDFLGVALVPQERFDQAHSLIEESQILFRAVKDKKGIALTSWHLGWLFESEGNPAAALPLIKQALTLVEELGDINRQSILLRTLGRILVETGEWEQGSAMVTKSIRAAHKVGSRFEIGNAFVELASVQERQTNFQRAVEFLCAAKKMYQACGMQNDITEVEQELARLRSKLDQSTFEAAIAEAEHQTMEDAIELALR